MQIKLTKNAAGAMWNALAQMTVKGRVEARRHARLVKLMREGVTQRIPAPENATDDQKKEHERQDQFEFKAGEFEISEKLAKYLEDAVEERLKAGVPGNLGHGYGELVMALDEVRGAEAKDE